MAVTEASRKASADVAMSRTISSNGRRRWSITCMTGLSPSVAHIDVRCIP